MRVLVACEESQEVCKAFRALGHEAYSCDIEPCSGGHPEKKATCLWLKGLPPLVPTNDVSDYMKTLPKNHQERLHYLPPSPDRAKLRSKTYPGIARAMAEQWGGICDE